MEANEILGSARRQNPNPKFVAKMVPMPPVSKGVWAGNY